MHLLRNMTTHQVDVVAMEGNGVCGKGVTCSYMITKNVEFLQNNQSQVIMSLSLAFLFLFVAEY